MIRPAPILTLTQMCNVRKRLGRRLGKVACTSGGFDPLHPDHIRLLLSAKPRCDTLVVFVSSDDFLRKKKLIPFMDHATRCKVVAAIRGVDYVVRYENEPDMTVSNGLRRLRPHAFLKGGDRTTKRWIPEWGICQALGIKVTVPRHCVGVNYSSSKMLNEYCKRRAALSARRRS